MNTLPVTAIQGPHQEIAARSPRERFTLELFDRLWAQYRQRVAYVQVYEQVVHRAGATFFNDHIAFRTFAHQNPLTGIASLSRLFEALDYRAAGVYHFPDKHLSAVHLQHPHPQFPKLFISELKLWELPVETRELIEQVLATHRPALDSRTLAALSGSLDPAHGEQLLERLLDQCQTLPWSTPERDAVLAVNRVSQYAAWVLVHGYHVNHFTALVNSHGVESLDDLEKTVAALRAAGVPMKPEIEGERGSKLRQSATEAVTVDVTVQHAGQPTTMPWTYAYFELAERNPVIDPVTGTAVRFEGFLGTQATHLFEMTKARR